MYDNIFLIILAFILDLLIGDPFWFPHPVRFIGVVAKTVESYSRRFAGNLFFAGVVTEIGVLFSTGAVVFLLLVGAAKLHPFAGKAVAVYFLYVSLATRDLARHSRDVFGALVAGDVKGARAKVSLIVGRDTTDLDEQGVCRACVESVSENIVDGITAPLFWAFIGGPVGAILYKSVNTMDSMFGYKNERYREFGWAAARLDDLANYIPARITAVLIIAASVFLRFNGRRAYTIWRRDRFCHSSPNSAQSEAAAAGALGIMLGGTSCYFGKKVEKPTIGDSIYPIEPAHIIKTLNLMFVVAVLALFVFSLCSLLFSSVIGVR